MKHPVKGWFEDSMTGVLEPFRESINQIHARHTELLKLLETLRSIFHREPAQRFVRLS